MLPFEFTVVGPPISLQAKSASRRKWKASVAAAATAALPHGAQPVADEVAVRIVYYYDGDPPDVDNIIKLIQDALIGVVYIDDAQVVHAESSRTRIDGSFKIRGASAVLLNAFSKRDEFLYITITEPPDMNDLQ